MNSKSFSEQKLSPNKNYTTLPDGALNELSLPILVLDEEGLLRAFNNYAGNMLGLDAAKDLGKVAHEMFPWLPKLELSFDEDRVDLRRSIDTTEGLRQAVVRLATFSDQGLKHFLVTLHDITREWRIEQRLRASEERWERFVEFLPDPIFAIDTEGRVTVWNQAIAALTEVPKEQVLGSRDGAHARAFWGVVRPSLADMALKGEIDPLFHDSFTALRRSGDTFFAECFVPALRSGQGGYLLIKAAPLRDNRGEITGAVEIIRDVTHIKAAAKALEASEKRLRQVTEGLLDIVCEVSPDSTILYVSPAVKEVLGRDASELIGLSTAAIVHPEDLATARTLLLETANAARADKRSRLEFRCATVTGGYIWAEAIATPVYNDAGELERIIIAIRNISDIKSMEEKQRFMNWHDNLTELYNRNYWLRRLEELDSSEYCPLGILLCDIDGLRLVNDALGHEAGDRCLTVLAEILVSLRQENEIVARIGGDEFGILLPGTNADRMLQLVQQVRDKLDEYNQSNTALPLSVSIGISIKIDLDETTATLVKRAEDRMYREKLNRSQSLRNSLVQALSLALEARDFGTEGHTQRVERLTIRLAQALDIAPPGQNDLRLLAQFHDIGKVGIPDYILFKPGPLTIEERQDMQRHSEIGRRIALSSPDLAPIADAILKHHEWWNGEGYPLGLKEQEIPLHCRILAIADAYDAMTSDRPYRAAMSKGEAFSELRRCAGSQFDPNLVPIFVDLMVSDAVDS